MIYTPEEVAEINSIDNRRRVSGAELSAIMGLIAAGNVLVSTAPDLYDHAEHICNRAMEQCDLCCTCTRDQSKDCLLRRAFDQVPGCKENAKKYARKDATSCPYRGMEMEVETDD